MLSLNEIEAEVNRLAAVIGASGRDLPTYGVSRDSGYPHVEVDHRGYHYVAMERGEETLRRTSQNLDDLLYWIFEGITHDQAGKFEVAHRRKNEDCRRQLFKRQVELISSLSRPWGERLTKAHQEILRSHPFNDA